MKHFTLSLLATFFCLQLFSQKNLTLLSNLPYGSVQLSNIWGYVDSLGNEYALVGTSYGVSIVDVTIPTNPIEIDTIKDVSSIWRELKVWNKHAYVTTEGGNGLLIIDLSTLPDASGITYTHFTGGGLNTSHTIFIDEKGIAYVFGSNAAQGAMILDLTKANAPTILGTYTDYYIHDGYVRGDTLWAGAIYDGKLLVIDASDKANLKLLASQTTPGVFTHNCWLTDDGKYIFTTDEVSNSYITSYDVSDLSNIKELDRCQSNPGSNAIVHNTYVVNKNFLATSYYKDGVIIVDATYPDNMVEVGNYDTYSQGAGDGETGDWGVYPYLPSGNLLVSDMINGLFVLKPTYTQACYLKGNVTDKNSSASLYNVSVDILTSTNSTKTSLTGDYGSGVADSGMYSVVFSKPGYLSDTESVALANGVLTILDVQLIQETTYDVNVIVVDDLGNPVEGAYVTINNTDFNFTGTTDTSGEYQNTGVYQDQYDIVVGKWGYITQCMDQQDIPTTSSFSITLQKGYYDDFTFDYGWTESGNSSSGHWERAEPIGTEFNNPGDANPEYDSSGDCSDKCFVTGNGGGEAATDDVDNGYTLLTSPIFNYDGGLMGDKYLAFNRWFFNKGGQGNANDSLVISITDGIDTVVLETITKNTQQSQWVRDTFDLVNYPISITSNMQLLIYTADQANTGHLVEAGIDDFETWSDPLFGVHEINQNSASLNIYPNPVVDNAYVQYSFSSNTKLKDASMVITNALGQKELTIPIELNQDKIDISNKLAAGIYFVSLINNKQTVATKRIVKTL